MWAKPADLPADDKIQCPEGQEKGEHGGIAIDLDLLSGGPAEIDVVNPFLIGAWFEQWLDAVANLLPAADPCEQQAQKAFEAAERCRRAGDYVNARAGYQQTHRLAPTSRLGRLAIDRLIEVEQRLRETGEEAEPTTPNPKPVARLEH